MTSAEDARGVIDLLVRAGVTDVVLAPGSRNAPLSFAAYDAAAGGVLRLHTRLDERTAGFLALGLTKVGARAAVMCTSGTAVANLHPAVLEAAHAAVPLVVVTADRPERLRGTSANQTTRQPGLFGPEVAVHDARVGSFVRPDPAESARLFELLRGSSNEPADSAGNSRTNQPTHLNVQFEDPLVPPDRWTARSATPLPAPAERRPTRLGLDRVTEPIEAGPRTVVVAGDDAGPPARVLAERAGWPLLAEPSSGSRTGDAAIRTYRLLLNGELGARIERAIVFGRPTLSRPVARLLANSGVEVWARREPGVASRRPFEVAREFDALEAPAPVEDGWLSAWKGADADTARRLDALLAAEPGLTPYQVAGAVARALPPEGLLVVGASNPIRDLDLMVPRYDVGARRKVIANRGLAGIDGTISTSIGAALGRRSDRSLALIGDVTFLHDLTGLVLGPDEPRPDLTIVVTNDDGGSIFATLEQGEEAYADRYDRLFGLPHGVDLASVCAATRTPHWRVESRPELEQALSSPNGGIEVVEARVRRDDRRALDERIRSLVAGREPDRAR